MRYRNIVLILSLGTLFYLAYMSVGALRSKSLMDDNIKKLTIKIHQNPDIQSAIFLYHNGSFKGEVDVDRHRVLGIIEKTVNRHGGFSYTHNYPALSKGSEEFYVVFSDGFSVLFEYLNSKKIIGKNNDVRVSFFNNHDLLVSACLEEENGNIFVREISNFIVPVVVPAQQLTPPVPAQQLTPPKTDLKPSPANEIPPPAGEDQKPKN